MLVSVGSFYVANAMPLANLLGHGLDVVATSFTPYEVQCQQGFKCVSRVKDFGMNHDGKFERPTGVDTAAHGLPAGSTYEYGCPARGAMTSSGTCADGGPGESGRCFSSDRFEAGAGSACGVEGAGKCMCVKPVSAPGEIRATGKVSEIRQGQEVQVGDFVVQSPANCDRCAQHSSNPEQCQRCETCEYITKDVGGEVQT